MSEAMTRVLEQAMALPPDERQEVAERLLDSVEPDGPPGLEHGSDEFWAEIQRRADDARAHPERLLSPEQVKQNVRDLLKRMRGE